MNATRSGEERTWVEITEPMMRSFVYWKIGAVKIEGFGSFVGKEMGSRVLKRQLQ